MHIIIVTDDVLYPTNSGGRSALLGECEALVAAGCELTLVVSHRNVISLDDVARHEELASRVVFVHRSGFAATSALHPMAPYQMKSRRTASRDLAVSLCRDDTVGVIASHEWTIPLAKSIAGPSGLQVMLRSHNDEVAYMHALAKSSTGLRKLYYLAEAIRLQRVLKKIYLDITAVAILSRDDSAAYTRFGLEPKFVPAVMFREQDCNVNISNTPPPSARLLFVGALDMPQAVAGLEWFCKRVLPRIRSAIPHAEIHVAGRRASKELSQFLLACEGVNFHREVEDLEPLYMSGRVFVNPVFSGSGVNIKVGPPAIRGIPIVTTTTGARGLTHLAPGFLITDDEVEFAASCQMLLENDSVWLERSHELSTRASSVSSQAIAQSLLDMFQETRV
ncbi:glycosyltransferase [Arthrobacter sp. 2MCAF15]|uniref:glycosyltransferase n=1 Tax=Arthrobacter sp. 2MCAF15 TaxID=3232984 RepID=UPI003F902FA0